MITVTIKSTINRQTKMQLSFQKNFRSVRYFDPLTLNPFSILTGENGSGKTHLLEAIKDGSVLIEGIHTDEITLFRRETFQQQESKGGTFEEIHKEVVQAYSLFDPTDTQSRNVDWKKIAGERIVAEEDQVCSEDVKNEILVRMMNTNVPKIKQTCEALAACSQPLHEITFIDFRKQFRFTLPSDLLRTQFGLIFSNHVIRKNLTILSKLQNQPVDSAKSWKEYEDEFDADNPKPWEQLTRILASLRTASKSTDAFNFRINSPKTEKLEFDEISSYSFRAKLVGVHDGYERVFSELSSGEKVLLGIAATLFRLENDNRLPKLLLLDEIDTALHPSMVKSLFRALEIIRSENGMNIILATHSPSTIALADSDSIYTVNKGANENKIRKVSQADAVDIASEGFITLNRGLSIFTQVSPSKINIISEGYNIKILKHIFGLHNLSNINLLDGLIDVSGAPQLRSLYDLVSHTAPTDSKFLFIWDCDVKKIPSSTQNVFAYKIPNNENNKIARKGIENAFPEDAFHGFTKRVTVEPAQLNQYKGTETKEEFDVDLKEKFADHMLTKLDRSLFSHFNPLIAEVKNLLNE